MLFNRKTKSDGNLSSSFVTEWIFWLFFSHFTLTFPAIFRNEGRFVLILIFSLNNISHSIEAIWHACDVIECCSYPTSVAGWSFDECSGKPEGTCSCWRVCASTGRLSDSNLRWEIRLFRTVSVREEALQMVPCTTGENCRPLQWQLEGLRFIFWHCVCI